MQNNTDKLIDYKKRVYAYLKDYNQNSDYRILNDEVYDVHDGKTVNLKSCYDCNLSPIYVARNFKRLSGDRYK